MVELVEDGQRPLVGKEDELVAAFVGREEVGGAAVGLQAGERAAVAVDDDRQGAESGVSEAGADAGRQAGEGAVDVVEAGGVPLLALAEEDDAFRQPALGRPENGGRCDGLPSRSLARGAGSTAERGAAAAAVTCGRGSVGAEIASITTPLGASSAAFEGAEPASGGRKAAARRRAAAAKKPMPKLGRIWRDKVVPGILATVTGNSCRRRCEPPPCRCDGLRHHSEKRCGGVAVSGGLMVGRSGGVTSAVWPFS